MNPLDILFVQLLWLLVAASYGLLCNESLSPLLAHLFYLRPFDAVPRFFSRRFASVSKAILRASVIPWLAARGFRRSFPKTSHVFGARVRRALGTERSLALEEERRSGTYRFQSRKWMEWLGSGDKEIRAWAARHYIRQRSYKRAPDLGHFDSITVEEINSILAANRITSDCQAPSSLHHTLSQRVPVARLVVSKTTREAEGLEFSEPTFQNRSGHNPELPQPDFQVRLQGLYQGGEPAGGFRSFERGSSIHGLVPAVSALATGLVMVDNPNSAPVISALTKAWDEILVLHPGRITLSKPVIVLATSAKRELPSTFPSDLRKYFPDNVIVELRPEDDALTSPHHAHIDWDWRVVRVPKFGSGSRYIAMARTLFASCGPDEASSVIINASPTDFAQWRCISVAQSSGHPYAIAQTCGANPAFLGASYIHCGLAARYLPSILSVFNVLGDVYGADEAALLPIPGAILHVDDGWLATTEMCPGMNILVPLRRLTAGEITDSEKPVPPTFEIYNRSTRVARSVTIPDIAIASLPEEVTRPVDVPDFIMPFPDDYRPVQWHLPSARIESLPSLESMPMSLARDEDGQTYQVPGYGWRNGEYCRGFRNHEQVETMYGCHSDLEADWTVRQARARNPDIEEALDELARRVQKCENDNFPMESVVLVFAADEKYLSNVMPIYRQEQTRRPGVHGIVFVPCDGPDLGIRPLGHGLFAISCPIINESFRSLMYYRFIPWFTGRSDIRYAVRNARNGQWFQDAELDLAYSKRVPFVTVGCHNIHPVGGGSGHCQGGLFRLHKDRFWALVTRYGHCYGPDELFFYQFNPLVLNSGHVVNECFWPTLNMPFRFRTIQFRDYSWGSRDLINYIQHDKMTREVAKSVERIPRDVFDCEQRPAAYGFSYGDQLHKAQLCSVTLDSRSHLLKPGDYFVHEGPSIPVYVKLPTLWRDAYYVRASTAKIAANSLLEPLVIVTFGSRGDRVPMEAIARYNSSKGRLVILWHVTTKRDGLMSLHSAERNEAANHLGWVTSARTGVGMLQGQVMAPMIIAVPGVITYSLAPLGSEARPLRPGTGIWIFDFLGQVEFASAVYDYHVLNSTRVRSLPRSHDGVRFLNEVDTTRYVPCGTGEVYYVKGSSSLDFDPGSLPENARPLPDGDHVHYLRGAKELYTFGNEGVVATARACGVKVIIQKPTLDRFRHAEPWLETHVHKGHAWSGAARIIQGESTYAMMRRSLSDRAYRYVALVLLDVICTPRFVWKAIWLIVMFRRLFEQLTWRSTFAGTVVSPLAGVIPGYALVIISLTISKTTAWAWAELRWDSFSRVVTPFARVVIANALSPMFEPLALMTNEYFALLFALLFEHLYASLARHVDLFISGVITNIRFKRPIWQEDTILLSIRLFWWKSIPCLHYEVYHPNSGTVWTIDTEDAKGWTIGANIHIATRNVQQDDYERNHWLILTSRSRKDMASLGLLRDRTYDWHTNCQTISLKAVLADKPAFLNIALALALALSVFYGGWLALGSLYLGLGGPELLSLFSNTTHLPDIIDFMEIQNPLVVAARDTVAAVDAWAQRILNLVQ